MHQACLNARSSCHRHQVPILTSHAHSKLWSTRIMRKQDRHTVCAATKTAAQHIILAPPASNTAPPESECLLVIAPGFTVGPADFKTLAETVQVHAPDVRLWAACMHLNYQALIADAMKEDPGAGFDQAFDAVASNSSKLESLITDVKDAAAAAGFNPRTAGWGRCTNLYFCLQSAAGVTLSAAAFKAVSGVILLASTLDGRYALGKLPSMEDWGRPVLTLCGELDGQMRWPWLAPLAADAAVLAQKAGPQFAAAHHPFILIPGANHAQTSNNIPNYERGDIPAAIEFGAATDAFGRAMGAFVTSHEGGGKSARQAATDELLLMVRQTAELMGPYFMASGMGDVCAAWVSGRQAGPESTASLELPDTTHHTHPATHPSTAAQQSLLQGARREAGVRVSAALHPGVVQKGERFVAAAQLKLASSLPREVLGRLRIVVQTHTEVEGLLYNQPIISEQPDGSVVVLVHALLGLPNLVRPRPTFPSSRPAAPEYWLKLKRPQAIAEALGLAGTYPDNLTAAALNQDALSAALAAVGPLAAQRYKSFGWQLAFGEDAVAAEMNAEKFIRQGAMTYEPTSKGSSPRTSAGGAVGSSAGGSRSGSGDGSQQGGLGVITVRSPVLTSKSIGETQQQSEGLEGPQAAAMLAATQDPYMHRFLGNWYTKCFSVAQAVEWVMLDSLRQENSWT